MRGPPPCAHTDFEAFCRVVLLEDTGRFTVEAHVRCAVCRVRFRWIGLEMGSSPTTPMTSVDGFELRAPIEPDAHLTSLMAGGDTGFPADQDTPPTTPQ